MLEIRPSGIRLLYVSCRMKGILHEKKKKSAGPGFSAKTPEDPGLTDVTSAAPDYVIRPFLCMPISETPITYMGRTRICPATALTSLETAIQQQTYSVLLLHLRALDKVTSTTEQCLETRRQLQPASDHVEKPKQRRKGSTGRAKPMRRAQFWMARAHSRAGTMRWNNMLHEGNRQEGN